ncbi:MAG: bifunctional riboflavin kinase/FAD synthetase [Gammaproteobacteria bacterium]|nr:bifunctional riboflavin kinase/FAD synthetase [Gammaproteobacteria bacterium]MDH5651165.1 bifunctional riboflavin kinase/FAD synthetase [Gammaproteobacteria bacterium]
MELIRGLHNLRPQHHGCVATIGNFDGVHLGHQAVIGQLADEAARLNCPAVVITFEPQPMEYFSPDKVPARLTRFREKVEALRRFAVDRVLCLGFNRELAGLSAEDFIRRILVEGLGIRYLVVGDDFRFGKGRTGDFQQLAAAGRQYNFAVVNMHTFAVDGERVSSTRIRQAMESGRLQEAERLLGRDYRMSGRVVHGEKLGRQLGYPTANIYLHRRASPLQGIFVVEVYGLAGEPLPGVASLGTRPTVDGKRVLLEVFLFDFNRDIYGEHIQVSFLHKLRDEEKFESLEALKAKIAEDVQRAQDYFVKITSR